MSDRHVSNSERDNNKKNKKNKCRNLFNNFAQKLSESNSCKMSKSIQVLAPEKDIEIIKLIVHKGSQVSHGKVLLLYKFIDSNKELVERLMSSNCGIVKKLLHKEGDIVSKR